jgi:type I restriction enzyme R subunit
MSYGPEYRLAEKPCIYGLVALGYTYLSPTQHDEHRDGQNHVLLKPILIEAIQRINQVPEEVARAVYQDLLGKSDNQEWIDLLRGNYSRTVPGQATKKTIHLIDFLNPANNTFTVTNQLYVEAQHPRIPDVVVYVNGIPLVVIEAKSPVSGKDKTGEAFEQIKQYERDIPRLFYSNLFNIVTDGVSVLYGATGAPSEHWGTWKDPWPKKDEDFGGDALAKGLYCLLEPSRLLDLLAHFIVFEKREEKVIKKVCRYQQYRAVNKLVDRVVEGKHRKGLIWHTQGSGKSLTMVYSALKLKTHRTIQSDALASPNILVLTDRVDLDDQIAGTFIACGLPNPARADSVKTLRALIKGGSDGLTVLSTIHKFEGSKEAVPNSANWILLVDECHRTQEKDLGAYLRATFPEARFFGFTGTPIKKSDKDTYQNFGAPGEGYLDKYGIDDAVADGATVPIHYTGRRTEWHLEAAEIDILFDQWFANEPDEVIEKIKQRGVTLAELAKHPRRVDLVAYDIWTHFKSYAMPDGFKAQIVAIDREAVILYKRALDKVLGDHLIKQGVSEAEAKAQASAMSSCVYSSNQEDGKPSEDSYEEALRKDLRKYYLDHTAETEAKANFGKKEHPLRFLIVCNKLLTGFDAPIESVMYLDNPLKEHNLLQAIARTNRVASGKQNGLIVDYIGVTKKLEEALDSYRREDVKNAMRDLDALRSQLKAAHAEVMGIIKGIMRVPEAGKDQVKAEYDALAQALKQEDARFTFLRKGKDFIYAYTALSPDPFVLEYTRDMKWVANAIRYLALVFDKKESLDHMAYSQKIRAILEEHLDATGLRTVIKLRKITDPDFWEDFEQKGKKAPELKTAAIRKSTELRKEVAEKAADNPLRYGPFSERLMEIIRRFDDGLLDAAEALRELEQVAKDLEAEKSAHTGSKLDEKAYGIYRILEAFRQQEEQAESEEQASDKEGAGNDNDTLSKLEQLAIGIDSLYSSDQTAPPGWHVKEQLRKGLRQEVRRILHPSGLPNWKDLPGAIEDYALKTYLKV